MDITEKLKLATCIIQGKNSDDTLQQGTGWLYKIVENNAYLLTAAHVLGHKKPSEQDLFLFDFYELKENSPKAEWIEWVLEERHKKITFEFAILKISKEYLNTNCMPLPIDFSRGLRQGDCLVCGYENGVLSVPEGKFRAGQEITPGVERFVITCSDSATEGFSGSAICLTDEKLQAVVALQSTIPKSSMDTKRIIGTIYAIPLYRISDWLKSSYKAQLDKYQVVLEKIKKSNESSLFAQCKQTEKGWINWYTEFRELKNSYDQTKQYYDIQLPELGTTSNSYEIIPPSNERLTPEKMLFFSVIDLVNQIAAKSQHTVQDFDEHVQKLLNLLNTEIEQNKSLTKQNQDLTKQNQDLTKQNQDLTKQNQDINKQNEISTKTNSKYYYIMIIGGIITWVLLFLSYIARIYFN